MKTLEDASSEPDLDAAKTYLCEIAGITPSWFKVVASFKAGTALGIFQYEQSMTSISSMLKHMHKILGPTWVRSIVKFRTNGWIFNHFTMHIDGRERRVSLNYRISDQKRKVYFVEFEMSDLPIGDLS